MENQNIEWKETWRDDYISCICGFANAQGGILEIGRNDKGEVIGLSNTERLLEDLPNKIRGTTGVLADINLHNEKGKEYISIGVKPYPAPVTHFALSPRP